MMLLMLAMEWDVVHWLSRHFVWCKTRREQITSNLQGGAKWGRRCSAKGLSLCPARLTLCNHGNYSHVLLTQPHPREVISQPKEDEMSQVRSWHLILLSFGIHLGLLFYADHVDSHPERYGGLKYTDVDWRVVMDGARLIFSPASKDQLAQGWLARVMQDKGWSIGE